MKELAYREIKVLFLGFLAGMAIGFGGYAYLSIAALGQTDVSAMVAKFLGGIVFSFALFLICIFSFKLYTGKIGYIIDKQEHKYWDLLFVFLGNVLGAVLFGFGFRLIANSNTNLIEYASNFVLNKMVDMTFASFIKIFLSAIFCGIIVFLAVFSYTNAKNVGVKILGALFPIVIFVVAGFEHIIANFFYFSFTLSFSPGALLNLLYVFFGNSLGAIGTYFLFKKLGITSNV